MISTSIGRKKINLIVWDDVKTKLRRQGGKFVPAPQNLPLDGFKEDLDDSQFPTVIGFDLDSLYGIDGRGSPDEVIGKRLRRAMKVLWNVLLPPFWHVLHAHRLLEPMCHPTWWTACRKWYFTLWKESA